MPHDFFGGYVEHNGATPVDGPKTLEEAKAMAADTTNQTKALIGGIVVALALAGVFAVSTLKL